MRLKYQEQAVINAKKIIEEHGGVFLADVVGLGKTYMAALLANQLQYLVITIQRFVNNLGIIKPCTHRSMGARLGDPPIKRL